MRVLTFYKISLLLVLGHTKLQPVFDSSSITMSKRGVYVVLVGCVSINVLLTLDQPNYLFTSIFDTVIIGLALLFFPLIGFLADVCFTRYQMIKASFAILSTMLILVFIVGIMVYVVFHFIFHQSIPRSVPVTDVICMVFIVSGSGLFEANAIQFGMDQLLEASSTQLIQSIHWYFWFMHIGQPVVYCVLLVSLCVVSSSLNAHISDEEEHLILTTSGHLLLLLWLICLLLAVYWFHEEKKHMYMCMLLKWVQTHSNVCGKS